MLLRLFSSAFVTTLFYFGRERKFVIQHQNQARSLYESDEEITVAMVATLRNTEKLKNKNLGEINLMLRVLSTVYLVLDLCVFVVLVFYGNW